MPTMSTMLFNLLVGSNRKFSHNFFSSAFRCNLHKSGEEITNFSLHLSYWDVEIDLPNVYFSSRNWTREFQMNLPFLNLKCLSSQNDLGFGAARNENSPYLLSPYYWKKYLPAVQPIYVASLKAFESHLFKPNIAQIVSCYSFHLLSVGKLFWCNLLHHITNII